MHVIIIHEEVKCRFDVYKVLRGVFVRVQSNNVNNFPYFCGFRGQGK